MSWLREYQVSTITGDSDLTKRTRPLWLWLWVIRDGALLLHLLCRGISWKDLVQRAILFYFWQSLFSHYSSLHSSVVFALFIEFSLLTVSSTVLFVRGQQGAVYHHWMRRGSGLRQDTLKLNRTSSSCLATLSASVEIDVREIKGKSEI